MTVPRLLPHKALLSMKYALMHYQARMLDEEHMPERSFNIDDVQRAIEWVEHEMFKRNFRNGG